MHATRAMPLAARVLGAPILFILFATVCDRPLRLLAARRRTARGGDRAGVARGVCGRRACSAGAGSSRSSARRSRPSTGSSRLQHRDQRGVGVEHLDRASWPSVPALPAVDRAQPAGVVGADISRRSRRAASTLVVIWITWWRMSPRLVGRTLRWPWAVVGALVLLAFVVVARRSPAAAAEPFTALFTAPGE